MIEIFVVPIRIQSHGFLDFRFLFKPVFHAVVVQIITDSDGEAIELRLRKHRVEIISKRQIGNFLVALNRVSVK